MTNSKSTRVAVGAFTLILPKGYSESEVNSTVRDWEVPLKKTVRKRGRKWGQRAPKHQITTRPPSKLNHLAPVFVPSIKAKPLPVSGLNPATAPWYPACCMKCEFDSMKTTFAFNPSAEEYLPTGYCWSYCADQFLNWDLWLEGSGERAQNRGLAVMEWVKRIAEAL